MNQIISARKRTGGWVLPLLFVVALTLIGSGVLSSDPEPVLAAEESAIGPIGVTEDPALVPVADDQAEFVEFGFDTEFGMFGPAADSTEGLSAETGAGKPVQRSPM